MDLADLKSQLTAAAMSVDDLASRAAGAEPAQAEELEIDANLLRHELEELDRALDRAKADIEDSSHVRSLDEDAVDDVEELSRRVALALDGLGDVERSLDDLPELSSLDEAAPVAGEDSSPEIAR